MKVTLDYRSNFWQNSFKLSDINALQLCTIRCFNFLIRADETSGIQN